MKLAKSEVWKRYGEYLNEISKTNPREFYKQVNRVRAREEEYAPSAGINDADGKPIHDAEKVKSRWREYFCGQLNPTGNNSETPFQQSLDREEPNILESEVRSGIKNSARKQRSWNR